MSSRPRCAAQGSRKLAVRILSLIHGVNAHAGVFGDQVESDGHELHQASYAMEQPPAQPVAWYDAVMVFGGSMNTHEEDRHPWLRHGRAIAQALEAELPVFGVCLGSQLLAESRAARCSKRRLRDPGWYEVELTPEAAGDPIFARLRSGSRATSGTATARPSPEGRRAGAERHVCLQAYRVGDRAWGIQFHAEVTRENAEAWISRYDTDPNAVAARFDPDSARAELADRIEEWNRIGRTLAAGSSSRPRRSRARPPDAATA